MDSTEALIAAYKRLAVEKGILPVSRSEIASAAGMDMEAFSALFPNLEALQSAVWIEYLRGTLTVLEQSDEYAQYSVREKLLAFYYTFFERLSAERSFAVLFEPKLGVWNYNPTFLKEYKDAFLKFMDELMKEGFDTKELEQRLMIGEQYAGWHWPQMLFLLNKWVEDKTEDRRVSDQAIEKAVNLGFDIMSRNVVDSALDFAKFMIAGH